MRRAAVRRRDTNPMRLPAACLRYSILCCRSVPLVALLLAPLLAAPLRLYVSPEGSDAWSGRSPTPAADHHDGPFATFERAQQAVRAADRAGGVTVIVLPGTYPRRQALRFGPADSGTPGHPVVWEAAAGARPRWSGAATVTGFQPVTDPALLRRLAPAARGHVLQASLPAQGISDYGTITQRGSPGLEVFCRGRRMTLARYPNTGWLRIASVPQTGPKRYYDGVAREVRFNDGIPAGRNYGRIRLADPRAAGWAPADDIYAHGYWTFDWSDSYQRIQAITDGGHELTFAEPQHAYGYTRNQRFYFVNVFEELDAPGEWYLDRTHGELYFYPPAALRPGDVSVSMLDQPFVQIDGAHDLQFAGFEFCEGRSGGVTITNSQRCRVAGCTFHNLGGLAADIAGGADDEIRSCDFYDLALGGIRVSGGDRATLTASHHRIVNNAIYDFEQWVRTGEQAIMIEGVGQYVAHNLIHDAPFEGMGLQGNDHLLEYNEVYHIGLETGDVGAIHTGRDYTWRGNVIRYNYWHDLKGPGLHGVTAVYLDDFSSGFTVTGNLFYRAGRAVQIGGGRDNVVTGNLFIDCEPSIHVDARGLSWASNYFDGRFPWLFDRFREVHGDQPPYSTRYPALRTLMADQPAYPKNNRVTGNVSWGGRWLDVYDYFDFDFHACVDMRDNVIADPGLWRRRAHPGPDPYYLNIDRQDGYVLLRNGDPVAARELAGNVIEARPPGTFDPVTLAFTPRDPAQLARCGFQPLPVAKMGLQKDAWRTSVPPRTAL